MLGATTSHAAAEAPGHWNAIPWAKTRIAKLQVLTQNVERRSDGQRRAMSGLEEQGPHH